MSSESIRDISAESQQEESPKTSRVISTEDAANEWIFGIVGHVAIAVSIRLRGNHQGGQPPRVGFGWLGG